jgi:hypothetical protein
MTEPLDLPRHPAIGVAVLPGRGRGVVALEAIRRGELLEANPVLPLPPGQSPAPGTALFDYPFAWDEPGYGEAIVLGLASLINHSASPNATLRRDYADRVLRVVALTDIPAGAEITYDYDCPLWFEAG